MSKSQAIAAVTAVLVHRVGESARANVEVGRPKTPDAPGDGIRKVNVYLYQVTENTALRNSDLPTRDFDGKTLRKRPQIALNLHYLLSFYGDEKKLDPQLMLGAVMRDLHAAPLFAPKIIEAAIQDLSNDDFKQIIIDSELDKSIELVKFTPEMLSLDELSKIWSIFFQTPHALSVAYQAAVVLIEKEVATETALPVRERDVHGVPLARPVIESIVAQQDAGNPEQIIKIQATVLIRGRNLSAEETTVLIDGIKVDSQIISDKEISLIVPSVLIDEDGTSLPLRAGSHTLQILHGVLLGGLASPEPHRVIESSPVAFLLHPTIQIDSVTDKILDPQNLFSAKITVVFDPKVAKAQRVWIFMKEVPAAVDQPPRAYRFMSPESNGVAAPGEETSKITFAVKDIQKGKYLVQAHVDGGDSLPVESKEFE